MIKEDTVFIKKVKFLKRNIAVLVCVAFISIILAQVAHAASQPSSSRTPFPKNSLPLLIPFFSSVNPVFTLVPFNPAMLNTLDKVDKKPVENPINTQQDKKSSTEEKDKKDENPYKQNGNSTSTKPANGKD